MHPSEIQCRGYYYLASPYSDASAARRQFRAALALDYQADLIQAGLYIYSPIGSIHQLAERHSLNKDYKHWSDFNKIFIMQSSGMIIAKMPGWEESEGIYHEITLCERLKKKIFTFHRESMTIAPYGEAEDAIA